jgi:predicted aldo/keto reductase-like oxidoreductase
MEDPKKKLSRRNFIGKSVASVVGAGLGMSALSSETGAQTTSSEAPVEAGEKPEIKEYRRLGRTGYKVSDIGFGNAGMQDPSLLEYAIERGINYVDTARQYYDMEKVIGQIFPAKRDKVWITTKLEPELVTPDVSAEDLMKGIEESLERLNTDYVDCCLIHSVGDPNLGDITRIQNENIYKTFEKAREQGKIRYWGASAHGPQIIRDFTWLLENTNPDMLMPGMNFITKGLEPVLAEAKKKDIAIVAMKSMSAARKVDFSDFKGDGRTVRQALLKWMLAQPNIDTVSITMRNFDDVDEFVAASGKVAPTPKDKKTMDDYGLRIDNDYCRPGCDGCLGSCPHDVPIHDILRYGLYFDSYGREKYAMGRYASLPQGRNAAGCADCPAPCVSSCTFGLPVKDKMVQAHNELTLA